MLQNECVVVLKQKGNIMKRMCCRFLACLLLTAALIASADLTESPYSYTLSDGNATITGFSQGYSGTVSITNKLGGYPVTAIGDRAFYECSGLTCITIPDSVTNIGTAAFAYCASLTSVKIPDSITVIEDKMFYKCSGLTSATIPGSVTSILGVAFNYCPNLRSIYFSGNPPSSTHFAFSGTHATLFFLPTFAPVWPSTFADCPTKLWDPTLAPPTFSPGTTSFAVTGSPPIPIALEATTNLSSGTWVRLDTMHLTEDSIILHDPDADSYPTRFYRIVAP